MRKEIEKLLQSVQKPARYAGGDSHSVYAQIPDRLTFLLNLKGRF